MGEMELQKGKNPVKYLITLLTSDQLLSNGILKISLEGNVMIQTEITVNMDQEDFHCQARRFLQ